jgi:hypothetical protein
MESSKMKSFGAYRFQIVPISLNQHNLFGDLSYEELVSKKNDMLSDIYSSANFKLQRTKGVMRGLRIYDEKDCLLLRIGIKKGFKIENKDFEEEMIDTYPNLLVGLNNNPKIQLLLIEKNTQVCYNTNVIAKILNETFNHYLKQYQLAFYVEPIFSKSDFWDMVKVHRLELKRIDFELIKPNLSNISSDFIGEFREFQDQTNSHKTNISLNAPENGILENITPENKIISGLINYQAEGGGHPSVRLKGLKTITKIGETVKEVHIEEAQITYDKPTDLVEIIKNILVP